jgi:short-subunit dehydrogenase
MASSVRSEHLLGRHGSYHSAEGIYMTGTFLSIGAGPGIGLSTARRFAAAGHKVVLAARSKENLISLSSELQNGPNAGVEIEVVDCIDSLSVGALIDRHASDLEIMHYNAAVLRLQTLEDQSIVSVIEDITIDVTSALVAIRQAHMAMVPKGRGSILLTGGLLATHPRADRLTLSAGKAALRCAAQALFPEFKPQGIHIVMLMVATKVAPGSTVAATLGDAFWNLHVQPTAQWHWEAHPS